MDVVNDFSQQSQPKREAVIDTTILFIKHGKFCIDLFEFPELTEAFKTLNSPNCPNPSCPVDIIRKVATLIGNQICSAFYMIPPIKIFELICDKFTKQYPVAQLNFTNLKSKFDYLFKFETIGVSYTLNYLFVNLTILFYF